MTVRSINFPDRSIYIERDMRGVQGVFTSLTTDLPSYCFHDSSCQIRLGHFLLMSSLSVTNVSLFLTVHLLLSPVHTHMHVLRNCDITGLTSILCLSINVVDSRLAMRSLPSVQVNGRPGKQPVPTLH